jgi:hypothetical protein
MQFQVPQNIAMEDRIVGNLTAIQFAILVLGGLLSFFIFTEAALPGSLRPLLAGGTAFLTVILGVGHFNDQLMYRFIKYIILFIITPKVRVWHKTGTEPLLIKPKEEKVGPSVSAPTKKVTREDIARLAAVLDTRGAVGSVPSVRANPQAPSNPSPKP